MIDNDQDDLGGGGVTRRELLKGAGLMAVTTGLFAGIPTISLAGTAKPKRGGTFRLGVVGSTIDGQAIVAKADQARLMAGFETLMEFDEEFRPQNKYGLAEFVEVKSTTEATVRLRKGLVFHDGKKVTADDVIYSWQRLLDPKVGLPSVKALSEFYDPAGITKVDALTTKFVLKKPSVGFKQTLAGYTNTVVPVGYTRDGKQNGTGPYRVASFTPGRESRHVRNAKYWRKGQPYFDEVIIQDFADKTALVNALLSGQIDAAVDIPLTSIDQIKANSNLAVNEVSGGGWLTIVMMTDRPPFNNPKVRQAMRLIINRPEILARALGGHGQLGNDLFGRIDEFYNANKYPQRAQDIPKAVALLKEAGYSADKPLELELPAPDDTGGLIPLAQAFAEQAKATGGVVKVTAKAMDAAYWDTTYAKVPFYTSFWSPRAYLPQIAATAGFGETLYEKSNPGYNDLFVKASGEADDAKRLAIVKDLQKMDYEDGAYIIPVFNAFADAYRTKVRGVVNRPGQLNLDYYGRGFQTLWFG
jgi:peptide/nickel transport system substrate-binding protein